MAKRSYRTVSDELAPHADAVADYLEELGYTVKIERVEMNYPYTPTMVAKRSRTKLIVEVDAQVRYKRLDDWARYGRSCQTDTRVAVCVPDSAQISGADVAKLHDDGIGAFQSLPDRVLALAAPMDLAVNAKLPNPASLHPKIRALLGGVYEQFDRSNWREGFDGAVKVVEVEARKYLIAGVASGRIVVLDDKGKPRNLTDEQINKMTLGALAYAFQRIKVMNLSDSMIAKVLTRINPDRVRQVHYSQKAETEAKLRKNVGQHMWSVIAVLRAILGVN